MRRAKLIILLFALCLLVPSARAAAPARIKILTIDPMMALIVRFIGGPYVETESGWRWDAKDTLRASRAALMNGENASLPLLALSRAQYERFMTSTRRSGRRGTLTKAEIERPNVRFLFGGEIPGDGGETFYGDPANMPYTAQRLMDELNDLAPGRTAYFQRRLGEFNARLSSVLISGRRFLRGMKILCMSELYRPFFKASGCVVTTPTPEELAAFQSLPRAASRSSAEAQCARILAGRTIVMDYHTAPAVRAALQTYAGAVYIEPPRDEDLLFFIHRIVLHLGSRN